MERRKRLQRFLSIFLACIMILNVPMSALAFEDTVVVDAADFEVYAEEEDAAAEAAELVDDSEAGDAILNEEPTSADEMPEVFEDTEASTENGFFETQSAEGFAIAEIETMSADPGLVSLDGETDATEGTAKAEDAEVSVTISVKGELAQTKDGSIMLDQTVTVKDINEDGKLTYDEALTAAHDAYYEGGAEAGYGSEVTEYGLSLKKLWGDTSMLFGYWKNDTSCWSLADEVNDGDSLRAFVYKDAGYSDAYIKFDNATYMTLSDVICDVALEKAVWDNAAGAYVFQPYTDVTLSLYDSERKLVAEDAYEVSEGGVLFKNAGTYYLVATETESQIVVPAVTKVIVSYNTMTAIKGITLNYTSRIVPAEKDDYTQLTATLEPADLDKVVVTWTSSNPEVAKVEDGKVYALSPGETVITASAGNVKAECIYQVTLPPTLSSIKCYADAAAYEAGNELKMTPAFEENKQSGYTVLAPDYLSQIYVEGIIAPEYLKYGYNTIFFASTWGNSGYKTDENGVKAYSSMIAGNKTTVFANRAYKYQLDIARYATLTNLVMEGRTDAAFNKVTNTYQVKLDHPAEAYSVTPTAYKDTYEIKVNGNTVKSGETYKVPYNWDADGKMTVKIEVSGEGVNASVYTLELEKTNLGSVPVIQEQPKSADYIENENAAALTVEAITNGTLTYQWYSNDTNSTENGTAIADATEKSYTPSTEKVGTVYYYCIITNTAEDENNTIATDVVSVVVDVDPTPTAELHNIGSALPEDGYEYEWNKGYVYEIGSEETVEPITVTATTPAKDGVLSYEWKQIDKPYAQSVYSYEPGGETTGTSYTPQIIEKNANNSGNYYGCQVTCTFKGKTYKAWATTGETYTVGEGENAKTYDVIGVYVFTKTNKAAVPTFSNQPKSGTYMVGKYASTFYAQASVADGGKLTYQWYVNDKNSTEDGTPIANATKFYYSIGKFKEVGTKYYYCIATNTNQGYTESAISNVAEIIVTDGTTSGGNEAVGDIALSGTGTKEDPYRIKTAQDYITVAAAVEDGTSFAGKYLRQERNITLPKGWKPIGVTKDGTSDIKSGSNLNPFSGILDGNGKTLTVPEGGLPLLGYVKGAEVYNLNIYGKKIAGYGLVNNLVGVGLSGTSIIIDGVTLKSGSSTLKSGLIGTYITTSGFAGCSATFAGIIRNCTIESNVVIGYKKDQSKIGSIAGRFQGRIENCVSHATVYGVDYVGGILGGCDNAMGECTVTGSSFEGTVEASGSYVGGIVGGGYDNSTAPNGIKVTITDCTAGGSVTGADCVGGILGGDGFVAQAWNSYTMKGNAFNGKIKATAGAYVGGIIGFYDSLNKNDVIVGNYYAADCGAEKGIGFVQYVDTNYAKPTAQEGTVYINTENTTDECPVVAGCSWKEQHNRTDDPLGVHAKKLASTNPNQEPEVMNLIISGTYKTEYYAGQKFNPEGMTVTAEWTDDTKTEAELKDLIIDDSAMSTKGWKNVKITYQGMTVSITVHVLSSIKVTFSLLGDSMHDSDTDGKVHTLADGNLEVWVPETVYYVSPDASVYDVMLEAAKEYGFVMIGDNDNQYNSMYVKGITWTYKDGTKITLSELDNGPKSGWMDVVNGVHPNIGIDKQTLEHNDVIVFHYTDDYTVEENKIFDQSQADAVAELIAELPKTEELTAADKAAVEEARAAYEALTKEQKALVSAEALKQLEAAEARIAELEKKPHVHSWDAGTVTKAATCTETGVKTYKCGCGETKTETIPAAGHKYGDWTTVSEATVKAAEVQKHSCSICGAEETKNVGSKLTPVLEVPGKLSSIKMKKGKTESFKVTMAKGDSVVSVKSNKTKTLKATKNEKTGKITLKALKTGTAKLTIKLESGKSRTYTVKITSAAVKTSSVSVTSVTNNKLTLKAGKTHKLKVTVKPFTSTQKLSYKSSNAKVVTVDENGKLEAVAPGKATITVTSGSRNAKITVTVPGIANVKSSLTVKKNKTKNLEAKTYGISGAVTYTSSNTKVATVNAKGQVKGLKKGTAKITIQAGSYKKTVTIKVK